MFLVYVYDEDDDYVALEIVDFENFSFSYTQLDFSHPNF